MSILLETTFGDVVVDLDVEGSPALCKNVLKLAKARYYTNTLVHGVVPGRYCQMGDPRGDGEGGCSIYGLIDSYQSSSGNGSSAAQRRPPDVTQSQRRFLQSQGRLLTPAELDKKGVVVAMEIGHMAHTIGSQFLITLSDNNGLKDSVLLSEGQKSNDGGEGKNTPRYISLGTVAEDSQNVLSKLNRAYCDDDNRPFADIRIQRALVVHDPFEDPPGMEELLRWRGVAGGDDGADSVSDMKEGCLLAPQSPTYDKPPEEAVPVRIQADDTTLYANAGWDDKEYEDEDEEDEAARQQRLELQEKQEEEWRQRQDTSRAVMLEMLGDRPDAEIQAPEDVLFVCKLNPLTNDEDLELIFSRFDQRAKAEIIRDPDTGSSLQYAFVEFTSKEACNEAYLKMNNALVDDRRIRVDFSQSVANVWDRYHKQYRRGNRSGMDRNVGVGRGGGRGGRGSFGVGRGRGRGRGRGGRSDVRPNAQRDHQAPSRHNGNDREPEFDSRRERPEGSNGSRHHHHSSHRNGSTRDERQRSRSRSRSRSDSRSRGHRPRRSRSRSNDSSEASRRQKKHRKKRRHRERSSRRNDSRSRSRSRDRERRKTKKHKHHRRREYSDEDEEDRREKRERKHHRHRDDERRHRRSRDERSRSR